MPGIFELTILCLLVGACFGLGAVPRIMRKLGYNWTRFEKLRALGAKAFFWKRFKPW